MIQQLRMYNKNSWNEEKNVLKDEHPSELMSLALNFEKDQDSGRNYHAFRE